MTSLAKIGIAGGGVLVCGVGIACATVYSLGKPHCIVIGDNNNEIYKGKFGEDFKYHLVSATSPGNESWWNWVFKNIWSKDDLKDEAFNGVISGKKLKDECEKAYGKVTKTEVRASGKDKYEKSVWRYCSVGNTKPVTVQGASEDEEYAGRIGQDHMTKLISVISPANDWFWEIQEKAFFKQGGIGSKAINGTEFHTLYEKKENDRGKNDTLRKACTTAYSKDASTNPNIVKDALVFCSLQAKGD